MAKLNAGLKARATLCAYGALVQKLLLIGHHEMKSRSCMASDLS
jgi:hypothetical protein